MGTVVALVVAGFAFMFIWANKTEYQIAYKGLSPEDASAIVEKLKELRVPYRLKSKGSVITVPKETVYDVRLELAGAGLPKGGGVGYEVFDKTDFGTTEFVQQVNLQRALQGELARTIREFDEVVDAKVMIVLPKDSVFIEETKPPSASILLTLRSDLTEEKVSAVVHLVASAIEDLTPERVTVVDTTGRILFKWASDEERAGEVADNLARTQVQYRSNYEQNLSARIQTMLERVVGKDQAIVRVTAEMDFDQVDMSEEIFDPNELNVPFVRSRKSLDEKNQIQAGPAGNISSVNPIVPPGGDEDGSKTVESGQKRNDTVNYELSKMVRRTVKPIATLTRLSVAAVIDGTYRYEDGENGGRVRKYIPRADAQMAQFRSVVMNAMGFSEDRGDQVSVESFQFSSAEDLAAPVVEPLTWESAQRKYGRIMANILLIILLFLFVIRPIVKTIRDIKTTVEAPALPSPEDADLLPGEREAEFSDMRPAEREEFLATLTQDERSRLYEQMNPKEKNDYLNSLSPSEKAAYLAKEDVDKAANVIRGWLSEEKE